jgi:hypothetical protein
MSKQKVTLILTHMAEQAAPTATINLWPAVQAHLQTSTHPPLRGSRMNTRLTQPNRLRMAALITLVLLLTAGVFLATPQGQAWAQSVLRFFTRQESDILPPPGPTLTVAPLALVGPSTQTSLPAATPTPPGCDLIITAHCPIAEVQAQVAFPIVQLGKLPQGVFLRGAVVKDQRATLVYACPSGCFLLLQQEPHNGAAAPAAVGASARIKPVVIQTTAGPVQGEYVQGSFTGSGDTPATWDSNFTNAMLRWEAAGIVYTLQWLMPPEGKAGVQPDEALLVALAESLSVDPPTALNLDHLPSAADASLAAGFTVKVPTYTPKEWALAYFSYDAGAGFVCLAYSTQGPSHPGLFVRQSASAPLTDLQPNGDPANAPFTSETIPVGGAEGGSGRYIQGFTSPPNACNGESEFSSAGDALLWRAGGVSYEIYGSAVKIVASSVTQMDMVRMAESMTGVVTILPDQLDPGHLWSLAEMEQYAGEHVFAPAILPEGYVFSHGVITEGQLFSVYQSTDPAAADSMFSKPAIYLLQCRQPQGTSGPCVKDLEAIPADVRETVQINGAAGIYAKGLVVTSPETGKTEWSTDNFFHLQQIFWQAKGVSFQMQVMWGEGIDKDQMIAMANSIQAPGGPGEDDSGGFRSGWPVPCFSHPSQRVLSDRGTKRTGCLPGLTPRPPMSPRSGIGARGGSPTSC